MRKMSPTLQSEELGPDRFNPEQSLACAVLTRAIRDYLGDTYPFNATRSGKSQAALTRSARLWIESPRTEEYTFEWVCDVLCIEANAIRARLVELEKLPEESLRVMSDRLQGYRIDVVGRPMKTRTDYLLRVRAKLKSAA